MLTQKKSIRRLQRLTKKSRSSNVPKSRNHLFSVRRTRIQTQHTFANLPAAVYYLVDSNGLTKTPAGEWTSQLHSLHRAFMNEPITIGGSDRLLFTPDQPRIRFDFVTLSPWWLMTLKEINRAEPLSEVFDDIMDLIRRTWTSVTGWRVLGSVWHNEAPRLHAHLVSSPVQGDLIVNPQTLLQIPMVGAGGVGLHRQDRDNMITTNDPAFSHKLTSLKNRKARILRDYGVNPVDITIADTVDQKLLQLFGSHACRRKCFNDYSRGLKTRQLAQAKFDRASSLALLDVIMQRDYTSAPPC